MRWLRNNTGKKVISFVELDRLACPKPCLQLACVSKLTEIDPEAKKSAFRPRLQ
jgi:hypothetical protein